MLRTHTTQSMVIALINAVVIVVIALGSVAYLKPAQLLSVSLPSEKPVLNRVVLAPVQANPPVIHSVYISEQLLRNWLNEAYVQHQTARVQTLLRMLNSRYERCCCCWPY
jgi:hypothetical protein